MLVQHIFGRCSFIAHLHWITLLQLWIVLLHYLTTLHFVRTADQQKNVLLALGRYNTRTHEGVARFAGQHNWHLTSEMAYFGRLPLGWKGHGIITLLDGQQDIIDFVKAARVPTVDLSVIRQEIAMPRVVGDHWMIGRVAAEHFLDRGFRNFAWFSTLDDAVTELRLGGFAETLSRHRLDCQRWTVSSAAFRGPDEWTAKRDFLHPLLQAIPKPAAVFAFHDIDASTLLDACAAAQLTVPDEIAILGTDNNELICESVRVPLSSVNHDLKRVGYEGAALLHRLMHGARPPKQPRLIPPRGITVRQSTEVLAVNHEPTRQALLYLQQNYRKRIGGSEAALASGLPRRTLEASFRQYLGRSINDELESIRLSRAKQLLLTTNLSCLEIASRTGFNTPQYFSNVFLKVVGQTPRRFRMNAGQGK